MTKDNNTGKNKEFYDLGKKMFDRLNPQIAQSEQPAAKTRSAFETWYRQAYNSEPDDFKKFADDGMYLDPSLNADWDVWQAALAQRQPLTLEQIKSMDCRVTLDDHLRIVQMTEAAHGIGAKA